METLILVVVISFVVFYLINKIDKLKNLFESKIASTCQLEFNFSSAISSNETILSLAGLTKSEFKEDYDKWPVERTKKWEDFYKSKDVSIGFEGTHFTLTYLSHDDVFIIEAFQDDKRYSYVVLNRTPNNTYLFDKVLVYYPSKDKDLRDEHLRLEVKFRHDSGFYLITAGIREFENKALGKSEYTKLFDFPFAKNGSSSLSDDDYEKFDFTIEKSSPWFDKDDFGQYVEHPWDTQKKMKHKSGAEATFQY